MPFNFSTKRAIEPVFEHRCNQERPYFIEYLDGARKIASGRANIQKYLGQRENPAWTGGFPNRMPYIFKVLENLQQTSQKALVFQPRDEWPLLIWG